MRARSHQVSDRGARVLTCHQALTHQHGVGAGRGVGEQVVRPAHARLRDLDDSVRHLGGQLAKHAPVNLEGSQVSRIDAEHCGPGVQRAV